MAYSQTDKILLPIFAVIILGITVGLYFWLRNKSEKAKSYPFAIIAITILVLEVIKQILALSSGSYNLFNLPFHFCSLFLYFFPMAVFAKGKLKQFAKAMSFVTSLLLFALFYIDPASIIGGGTSNLNTFAGFHTVIYHHLAIMWLPLSIALNFYKPKKFDFVLVVIGFLVYFVVAVTLAHLLDVNFVNMLKSNIGFMENLRLSAGYFVYYLVMVSFALGASTLTILSYYYILRRIKK